MKKFSAESAAAASGSTNLGALLKAKLDNKNAE
jgi:small subunit ribosomal protein S1